MHLSAATYALLHKALDPNKPSDFLRIVNELQRATQGLAGAAEADALRKALRVLDVDWKGMDRQARFQVFQAAKTVVDPSKLVLPKIEDKLIATASKVGGATRKSAVKEYDLKINVSLSAVDRKVLERVASSQSNFIRDAYGKRSEQFSETARKVVEAGLKEGASRKQIAEDLQAKLGAEGVERSKNYWALIAGTFANRARTYANLSSYSDAGIESFRFQSVRDERTSAVCRFMHGKVFKVSAALKAYKKTDALDDPGEIADTQPWVSEGKDEEGNRVLYYRNAEGTRRTVAGIEDSGAGRIDAAGTFDASMSDKQLASAGIMTPPLHGHCRSTIVPEDRPAATRPGRTSTASPAVPAPPPPPAPKPAAPARPKLAEPEVIIPHLADAFARFDKHKDPNHYASSQRERMAAEKDIRQGLRGYIGDNIGAQSQDERDARLDRDRFQILPAKKMAGANAHHEWEGQVAMRDELHDRLQPVLKAMGQVVRDGASAALPTASGGARTKLTDFKDSEADPIRTLLHEELHGFSRGSSSAYQGIGVGIEEAQTEILARKMARKLFGETTDRPDLAQRWALPKVTKDNYGHGDVWEVQGGKVGSYGYYLGSLLMHTADAGKVAPDKVGKIVEDAFEGMLRSNRRYLSGAEHVDGFVDQLEKDGHVTRADGKELRKKLKDPKGDMAPPK